MNKDAYYFSHDANARHDPKLVSFCLKRGIQGYAYFFMLIELLREQKDYILKKELKPCLYTLWGSYEMNQTNNSHPNSTLYSPLIANEILQDLVNIGLIQENENGDIFSASLMERMSKLDQYRNRLSEAGKFGAIKRWGSHKGANATLIARKESKVNKSKVNISDCDFFKNSNFVETFQSYLAMRIKIKKPATDKAQDLILKRLVELSNNNVEIAIKILEQSILNSWQGVFVLRQDKQNSSGGGIWNSKL